MDIVVVLVASVVAGVMHAITGFGFSVVFTPLVALAIGARPAIAASMLISLALSSTLYWADRPRAPLRGIALLVLASTVTTPFGVAVLTRADERLLHAAIGVAVLASVAVTLRMPRPHAERLDRPLAAVVVGLLSGVLRGATSMGGPPMVLYEHWRGASTHAIRSRLIAFFAVAGAIGVAIAAAGGVFTAQSLTHSAVALPAVGVSIIAGRHLRGRVSDLWFRRLSMGLLAVMGALSLATAVR